MKLFTLIGTLASLSLLVAGCGSDESSSRSGSCIDEGVCVEVMDPPGFDVQTFCNRDSDGDGEPDGDTTYSSRGCRQSNYELKCTRTGLPSGEGSSPGQDATYVYYYKASDGFDCTGGQEEEL